MSGRRDKAYSDQLTAVAVVSLPASILNCQLAVGADVEFEAGGHALQR